MFRKYSSLFAETNRDNLLVFADGGGIVSHVGQTQRWACIAGCTVRVACIGSVATHEDYRAKGLASRLFQAACRKAAGDGVDFMMISGGRGLYRRAGATEVGYDLQGTISRDAVRSLWARDVELSEFDPALLPECALMYESRQAHFIRPADEWVRFVESRFCYGSEVAFKVVRRHDVPCAYLVIRHVPEESLCRIVELGGEPTAIAAALVPLLEMYGAGSLDIQLQAGDIALAGLLRRAGVPLETTPTLGTLLLLNFPQLVARLRPYFEARLGLQAGPLALRQEGDDANSRFSFVAGTEEHVVQGKAAAAETLFGHPNKSRLPGFLGKAFPVPTLRYGLNYI